VLKRFGLMGGLQGAIGRKRRLGILESAALDGRHRVVLVRRDDVEHLLLVGPNTSQVIETGIEPPASAIASEQSLTTFSQFLPPDKEP
jgi:flagellar protein FliO/FliZ